MRRFLLLTVTFVLLLSTLTSCFLKPKTDEELIYERIDEFLTSYNSGDFEGVLNCLDAKTRNATKAMTNLMGSFGGSLLGVDIDLADLFGLGAGLAGGDMMNVQITELIITSETTAQVHAVMTMKLYDQQQTQTIIFGMVKENKGWFIQNMIEA